ncbi:MAG: hypothetical protein ACRDKF_10245 [Actinomycetota bacterium]
MFSRGVRLLACAVAAAVALSVVPVSAVTNKSRARTAAGYIARQQKDNGSIVSFSVYGSTADAIVALVAARRGQRNIDRALNFMARRVRSGRVFKDPDVGVLGKIVMAVEAGGRNARNFGGRNLVRRIANLERPSGRLGRGTEVYSQGLLILGLRAAGKRVPRKVSRWLAKAQCDNGGWAFDKPADTKDDDETCRDTTDPKNDFAISDSNTTAVAIMALEGVRKINTRRVKAFDFLATLRDSDRGWGYTTEFPDTDANSTSLVIQAYLAAGRQIPSGAMAALRKLQVKLCGPIAGAFRFQSGGGNPPDLGATIAATPALMKKPLPLESFTVTKPVPARQPCR